MAVTAEAVYGADLPCPHALTFSLLLASVNHSLDVFFDLVPTGAVLYTPVLDADGEVVDFRFVRLNPAGQRLLGLPAQPPRTFREYYPNSVPTGIFDQYRTAYLTGQASTYDVHYGGDGIDTFFRLVAQRSGELLVVSFTDMSDLPRSVAEQALHESRAREQAARAEAERQQAQLYHILEQAPAMICVFDGPQHVFEFVNPPYQALVGSRPLVGKPIAEAMPELAGQPIFGLLDQVYQTGETFYANEMLVQLDHENKGRTELEKRYYNFIYQARYSQTRAIDGIFVFAYDVTTQVEARQQVEASNAELAAAAQAVERERNLLQAVLTQAPVAIGLFQGPEITVAAANDQLCSMWGYAPEQIVGRPLLEGVPELRGQGFDALIAEVARTRVPFVGTEVAADLRQANGRVESHYFNFVYQPLYGTNGALLGVLDIAIDVTAEVTARQQVQHLNAQLADANEELQVANEELQANNTELLHVQQGLQQLTQELETRVQQRTQQATQQAARLSRLIQEAPAAIALLGGPQLVFELLNDDYQALFPDRQLLGLPVLEAVPELTNTVLAEVLQSVYRTGVTFEGQEFPIPFAGPDGQLENRYFDFIYQARYDAAGAIDGLVIFGFDVTERVQRRQQTEALQAEVLAAARRRVAARENVYQIFTQAPAAIALLREPDHQLAYFNPAFEQLFPAENLLGRTVADAYPALTAGGLLAQLDSVYQNGETYVDTEVALPVAPLPGHSDHPRYFNFTYQAYREEGRTAGVAVFLYEVTEQVLARQQVVRLHQEIAAQREFLQQLVNVVPAAVATFEGPEHRLSAYNEAYRRMMNRPLPLGRPVSELSPDLIIPGFSALLTQLYQSGQPEQQREVPVIFATPGARQGTQHYLDINYQPVRDAVGRSTGILVSSVDVTAAVQARRQVQDLNEEMAATNEELTATNDELFTTNAQLTRVNTDLDSFVYTASHDLKAPITNIEGLLTVLREELALPTAEADTETVLQMMEDSVQRFQRTLKLLTDVTRLQASEQLPIAPVSIAGLVTDIRLDLQPLLTVSGGVVTLDPDGCDLVTFAEKHLRSILYNLISNALKYRHPDRAPRVQVRCHLLDRAVMLEVQDNGLGLTEPQQARVFGMFQRMHDHVEGTGIGLYLVKQVIDAADGHISIESQAGVGSLFRVVLPQPNVTSSAPTP